MGAVPVPVKVESCKVCGHPAEYHVISCMAPVVRDGATMTKSGPQRVVERCGCPRENARE